ncbi:MAG: lysylphosphatidylglycerol synthase transmembrane domain-containing protein [Candidatus Omnitrophota bacterium]
MKTISLNILRILVSFFLLCLLFWFMRRGLPDMYAAIISSEKTLVFYSMSLFLVVAYLIALRLKIVLSAQLIRISVKESVYLTFIGYFFNNFLPTSFGGDVFKAYYIGKKSGRRAGSLAGVFMDRMLAMIPFTLIPVITITFFNHRIFNRLVISAAYMIFLVSVIFVWMLLHRNSARRLSFILLPFKETSWYDKARSGYDFLNIYSKRRLILLQSLALSIVVQVLSVIATYILARALGIHDVGIGVFFIVVPVVGILTLIPSLNGLGVREGGYVYLLSPYMDPEKALALSIMVLVSLLIYSIIGGFIYGFQRRLFSADTASRV